MKVIVTGATGFIGNHVTDLLYRDGWNVLAVARSAQKSNVQELDLMDKERTKGVLKEFKPDYLLHLAWNVESGYENSPDNLSWLISSLELLKSFYECGGSRAVFAGSCFEYDWRYGYLSEEFTPLVPNSFYGVSKKNLYEAASAYALRVGLSFAWGRVFFLYGEGEKDDRLIPYIIRSVLSGVSPSIRQPSLVRDYMHVKDVASAFIKLLSSNYNGALNIASGEGVKLGEISGMIARIVGRKITDVLPVPFSLEEYPLVVGNIRRLYEELSFKPQMCLFDGLEMTVKGYKGKSDVC